MTLSPVVAGAWRFAEWQLGVPERLAWIEARLDAGITSFDHADIYGDYRVEALFGEALAQAPQLRRRMQLVSKCGIRLPSATQPGVRVKHYDTSRAHVLASVHASLAALRTDHLDVLLIHRPDWLMDPAELAATFAELRAAGKVLAFGASNFSVAQFALLHAALPLATHQVEFSALHPQPLEDGTLDQCLALGLRPMAWSPLAGGRVFTSDTPAAVRLRAELSALQAETGHPPVTLLAAWLMRHPSRPHPIVGSRRLEVAAQAQAAQAVVLSPEQWTRLWCAASGHEVP